MKKTYLAIAAGAVLGVLNGRFLFLGSWLAIVLWAVAGIALGAWGTKNEAIVNGVVYGFVLSFAFLVAGYSGKFSLTSRIPFFAVLGVFGGVCGLGLGLLGFYVRANVSNRNKQDKKKRIHPGG